MIDKLFDKYFPMLSREFSLSELQKNTIKNVIDGKNTLCFMPTGGGKSLTYWLSGLAFNGITIVISPLIALIDEQAENIREHGYEVLTIHASVDGLKQANLLKDFYHHKLNPNFIFVSPERIATDGFFEYCIQSRKDEIKLIAIDEIHCISQWGASFRPFYKRIPNLLDSIFGGSWPIVLGLTATLNDKEIGDICEQFKMTNKDIIKSDKLIRPEIELKKIKFIEEDEKEEKLWELLRIHNKEKTLVYLYRKYNKRGTEDLKEKAISKGFRADNFHGDMTATKRQEIIKAFKNGDIDVIFCTNAFGMGIDIPDIRVIIHFMIPETIEQYYQEVGRAARDKKQSSAYLLYSNKNIQVKKSHFINGSYPTVERIKLTHSNLTSNKIGLKTLRYFDEEDIQTCLNYLLDYKIISIVCKSFADLDMLEDIQDHSLQKIYDSTTTKNMITTIKNSGINPKDLTQKVYSAIIYNEAYLKRSFKKCLIIENHYEQIPENLLKTISTAIEENKDYKHKLLDRFVYYLNECQSSKELMQEIGLYLGEDKYNVGKIYKTLKGDMVRSKSEVIIADLLYKENIDYKYEQPLKYTRNKYPISPDFTIYLDSGELYWEHLGMIGIQNYDNRWLQKLEIYNTYFPGKLIKTYEGANLSNEAELLIQDIITTKK